jgi:hypothetical protein
MHIFLGSFCIAGIILWWACSKANRDYDEAIQALVDDGRIVTVPEFVTEHPKDIEYFKGDYSQSTMAYLHSETVPVLDAIYEHQCPWGLNLEYPQKLIYTEYIDSLEYILKMIPNFLRFFTQLARLDASRTLDSRGNNMKGKIDICAMSTIISIKVTPR